MHEKNSILYKFYNFYSFSFQIIVDYLTFSVELRNRFVDNRYLLLFFLAQKNNLLIHHCFQ